MEEHVARQGQQGSMKETQTDQLPESVEQRESSATESSEVSATQAVCAHDNEVDGYRVKSC